MERSLWVTFRYLCSDTDFTCLRNKNSGKNSSGIQLDFFFCFRGIIWMGKIFSVFLTSLSLIGSTWWFEMMSWNTKDLPATVFSAILYVYCFRNLFFFLNQTVRKELWDYITQVMKPDWEKSYFSFLCGFCGSCKEDNGVYSTNRISVSMWVANAQFDYPVYFRVNSQTLLEICKKRNKAVAWTFP